MKRIVVWMTAGAAALSFAGCARIQTRVVEKPRVDQEVQGNRGYLKGSGPSSGNRSSTRQMLETNIELPTAEELNPWRKHPKESAPVQRAPRAPVESAPSREWQEEESIAPIVESEYGTASAPAAGTTYVVQKNDTLQKISKKFYGTTKKWTQIFKANENALKSPDKIRPGQTLTIPELDERGSNEYK